VQWFNRWNSYGSGDRRYTFIYILLEYKPGAGYVNSDGTWAR
jgi:hypothetical protein